MPVKLSAKQFRKLTGQGAEIPAKVPAKRATKPVEARKAQTGEFMPPTVGMRYRVKRGMSSLYTTPPPVGTVCETWQVTSRTVYLIARPANTDAALQIDVSEAVLREYFEEEA